MADIVKGIRFMLGKEKSCMWEDTMAVIRAGYWIIALIIVIVLLCVLTGCSSKQEDGFVGEAYLSCLDDTYCNLIYTFKENNTIITKSCPVRLGSIDDFNECLEETGYGIDLSELGGKRP